MRPLLVAYQESLAASLRNHAQTVALRWHPHLPETLGIPDARLSKHPLPHGMQRKCSEPEGFHQIGQVALPPL